MVTRFLESKSDVFYALLRIVSGLMFAFHGVQKHFGVLTNFRPAFGTQLWFGGVIELVCGLAIAVGIFTRWAALANVLAMLGAIVFVHLKKGFWAHEGGYEYVLVLLVATVAVAMIGGGALSLKR